jgi:Fur family ferric uptake transcriptional regulator
LGASATAGAAAGIFSSTTFAGAGSAATVLAGLLAEARGAGSSIKGFFDAQPVKSVVNIRQNAPVSSGARLKLGSSICIRGLKGLSNCTKTLYDKADILNLNKNMPNNPSELKASGLKATLPRLKILDIFQKAEVRHLSAEDVYKMLLNDNLDVGLATVYRVLTQFEQAGLLQRNHFETGKAVFELNEGSHHDHLVCLSCGKVEEFFDAEIEKRQERIAEEHGFEIADHALALYGHCKNCQKPKK